jgi:hypothetical protein
MTILAILCAGAAIGLGSLAVLLYLASKAQVHVGQGRSVIPRVDIRA